jgi:hypothetical protein
MTRIASFVIASVAALAASGAVADEIPAAEQSFNPPVVSDVPYPPLRPHPLTARAVTPIAREPSVEPVRFALAPRVSPQNGRAACVETSGAYDRACLARTFYLTMGGGF